MEQFTYPDIFMRTMLLFIFKYWLKMNRSSENNPQLLKFNC